MEHISSWSALMIIYWQRKIVSPLSEDWSRSNAEINKYVFQYHEQIAGEDRNV
jgi:hypothetical protein